MSTISDAAKPYLKRERPRSLTAGAQEQSEPPGIVAVRRPRFPFQGGSWVAAVAIGDFLVSAAALCLAWWLRFHTGLVHFGNPEPLAHDLSGYSGHILLGAMAMSAALLVQRAYSYEKLLHEAHEIRIVVTAIAFWLATYLSLSLMLKFQPAVSRLFCLMALGCLAAMFSYWRLIVAHYLAPRHSAHSSRRRILLIGWNGELRRVADFVAQSRNPEIELCGVLVPPGKAAPSVSLPRDLEVVGTYEDLAEVIDQLSCDGVIVGDLDLGGAELSRIALLCEEELVDFEVAPTCFPILRSRLSLRHIGDVPVLGVGALPLYSTFNLHFKRLLDIAGALFGIVVSAPLLLLFGYLIARESPGPVFYRQRRIGVNGSPFTMLKMRTMHLNAEADSRPGWTVKDDPRRLRIGKLMRAWNIDELPQFFNVLKGDMSLVGPRPERPEFVCDFKHEIPHYNLRHSIKPGMTGWAQVHGYRGDTDLAERIRHDLHYIENWNLWMDLRIMVMTIVKPAGGC